ncbi:MAG: hypothetical protein PHF74_05550 [Dehalococcoidales bacterium]|nr:hypothetical protein [Dehalococcoidales bacterium]
MAVYGTSTVGPTIQADLSPIVRWLLSRNTPEYKAKKGLEQWYKTGGELDPETERILTVINPEALARTKAGQVESLDQAIAEFFPKEVTTPPAMTEQQVQHAGALPAPTQPAPLFAPQAQQPLQRPSFQMPQYRPEVQREIRPPEPIQPERTFAQGFEQPYLQQMTEILTKPRTEMGQPSLQQQIGVLAKLQQAGQSDLVNIMKGLLPSVPGGEFGAFMQYPEEYQKFQDVKQRETKQQPNWRPRQIGNDWYMWNDNAATSAEAKGEKITTVEDKPDYTVLTSTDEKGKTTHWRYDKNTDTTTKINIPESHPKPTTEKTGPYRPQNYAANIANALKVVSSKPDDENLKTQVFNRLVSQYPQYQNEIKGILWAKDKNALAELMKMLMSK